MPLFPILSLLAKQYRTILQIKGVSGSNRNASHIAQTIGANPFFVRKCMEKEKNFKAEELAQNLNLLLEADLKLKTGGSQDSTFELLLTSICLPKG